MLNPVEKRFVRSGFILLIFLLTLCPSAMLAQSPCSNPYIVQKGDVFGRIAQKCGVTLVALRAANPQVTNPNLIKVGQHLNLPAASEVVPRLPETGVGEADVTASPVTTDTTTMFTLPCERLDATTFAPTPMHLSRFLNCGESSAQIAFQALGIAGDTLVDLQQPVQVSDYTIHTMNSPAGNGPRELLLVTTGEGVLNDDPLLGEDSSRYFTLLTFGNVAVGDDSRFDLFCFLYEAGQWRFYGHTNLWTESSTLAWQTVSAAEGNWLLLYSSGHGTGVSSVNAQWFSLNGPQLTPAGVSYPSAGFVSTDPAAPAVEVATTATFRPRDAAGFTLLLNFRITYAFLLDEIADLTLQRQAVYRWDGAQNRFVFAPDRSGVSEEQIGRMFNLGATDFLRFANAELYTLARTGAFAQRVRLKEYLLRIAESPEQQAILQLIDLDK
jgi:LysM repeat protein